MMFRAFVRMEENGENGRNAQFYRGVIVIYCPRRQSAKIFKKPLDKRRVKCYNMQAVNERNTASDGETKSTKKVEKLLQNPLTKRKGCAIICKSRKTRHERAKHGQIIDN